MQAQPPTRYRWIALIPNALSAARLAVAVAMPFMDRPWQLAGVFIAAFTDLLDGYTARRFKVTSWQGGLLDAVADKAFVLITLTVAWREGLLAGWQVFGLIARDIVVVAIAGYGAVRRDWATFQQVPARWPGKVATTGLFVAFVALFSDWLSAGWRSAVVHATIAAAVVAAVDYLLLTARVLRGRRTG